MRATPFSARVAAPSYVAIAVALYAALLPANELAGGASSAQDKPDRPPWAQKSKSANGDKNQPAPADDSQDTAAQRGRIRVSVNLVNVLVSVLDQNSHPPPHIPQ